MGDCITLKKEFIGFIGMAIVFTVLLQGIMFVGFAEEITASSLERTKEEKIELELLRTIGKLESRYGSELFMKYFMKMPEYDYLIGNQKKGNELYRAYNVYMNGKQAEVETAGANDFTRISLAGRTDTSITVSMWYAAGDDTNNFLRMYDRSTNAWTNLLGQEQPPAATGHYIVKGLTGGRVYDFYVGKYDEAAGSWRTAKITTQTLGAKTASLEMIENTPTSVTLKAQFPTEGVWSNVLRFYNKGYNGWLDIGNAEFEKNSGTYTIENLSPDIEYEFYLCSYNYLEDKWNERIHRKIKTEKLPQEATINSGTSTEIPLDFDNLNVPDNHSLREWPVDSGEVTMWFESSGDPNRLRHNGIDVQGLVGDIVYSLSDGLVVYSGTTHPYYGNVVYVDFKYNNEHYQVRYAHLRNKPFLKVGEIIRKDSIIGQMGLYELIIPEENLEIRKGILEIGLLKSNNGKPCTVNGSNATFIDPDELFDKPYALNDYLQFPTAVSLDMDGLTAYYPNDSLPKQVTPIDLSDPNIRYALNLDLGGGNTYLPKLAFD